MSERAVFKSGSDPDAGRFWHLWLGWLYVERARRRLHVWLGPVGVHLFWPPWHSRLDYCPAWREDLVGSVSDDR